MEDESLFKDLDEAVERVLARHFDIYFDEEDARKALRRWAAKRTPVVQREPRPIVIE